MRDVSSLFGVHSVIQEEELLIFRWNGELRAEDVCTMWDLAGRVRGEHGMVFGIFDSRRHHTVGPEARAMFVKCYQSSSAFDATAALIGSHIERVLVMLVSTALRVRFKSEAPYGIFFAEAEARAFIDGERRRLRAQQAGGGLHK